MNRRTLFLVGLFGALLAQTSPVAAQGGSGAARPPAPVRQSVDDRAIRRDVPLTNSIRKALEAGTRDFTGRPGPTYWQLQTDYTINVSLNPQTQTLAGVETVVIHNNSGVAMHEIVLRLDHNIFRATVPRGFSVPAETTEGMVVTRLRVDGVEVNLQARPPRQRGGETSPSRLGVFGMDQTVARISLATPVAPRSTVTLDLEWHSRLPGGPNGRGHRMTQRWQDEVFQPTQWYPRVAKFDDLRGWDTNVYLGPAEFYNNFGRFEVRIDVPVGWIVSGTGVLKNPEDVLTTTARERLSRVLDSDEIVTIVGEDERDPGQATAPGESLVWHFVADFTNQPAPRRHNSHTSGTRSPINTEEDG